MTSTLVQLFSRARRAGVLLVLAPSLGLAAPAAGPASPVEAAPPQTNAPPQAVFALDLPNGRDPFFPNSVRLQRKAPGDTNVVLRASSVLDHLALKGISIGKRRLALINNLTLAQGEKGHLKLGGQKVLLHCVAVRDRSVLVSVPDSNESRELYLRDEK
jgi:hypothetical protein